MKPKVQVLSGNLFQLLEDFEYVWDHKKYPLQKLCVKRGFLFDGASIPKAVHSFIGTWDLGLVAPLFHDALYECAGDTIHYKAWFIEHSYGVDGDWRQSSHLWVRSEADRLFFRHMREADVPRWKRSAANKAVRLFGRRAWNQTYRLNASQPLP